MKLSWLLVTMACIACASAVEMRCRLFRKKLSESNCSPVGDAKPKDCYNPCTGKPILPADCEAKASSHCCLHDCRCIMKGAGNVTIPKKYQLMKLKSAAKKNSPLLEGCTPSEQSTPLVLKPDPKKPKPDTRQKAGGSGKGQKAGAGGKGRKPKTGGKGQKPAAGGKGRKPGGKGKGPKPTPKKPTTKPKITTKKPKKTTCKPAKTGRSVFDAFASLFSGFGFGNVEVVRTDC